MSFGLGNGRDLVPGDAGIEMRSLAPLPDAATVEAARAALAFDPRAWFPQPTRRFELEIGSGKGTFLLQQAELEPETNFLGIEWAGEFWAYAADRIRRRGLRERLGQPSPQRGRLVRLRSGLGLRLRQRLAHTQRSTRLSLRRLKQSKMKKHDA